MYVKLIKQCQCESSSSGPRLVQFIEKQGELPYQATTYGYKLVAMACDKCDTPWKEEEI